MRELLTLLRLRSAVVCNAVRGLRGQSRLKIAFVTLFGLGVWLGVFLLFIDAFGFVSHHLPEIKGTLIRTLFLLFFMTLLVMLAVSNGIISYAAFFKSRETTFLVSTPTRFETIFAYKFCESLIFSSWAMLILGAPLLIAHGIDMRLGWQYYPASFCFLATFILIPAELGSFAAMFITRHLPALRSRAVLGLGAATVLVAGIVGLHVFARLSFSSSPAELWMENILAKISFCRNPLLPSYWVSLGIADCGEGKWGDAAFFWCLTLSNAMFGFLICYWYAGRQYETCWSQAQSPAGRARVDPAARRYRIANGLLFFLKPRHRLLVMKDVKSFMRDPVQWSQVLIFFGLLCVYILNLRNLSYDIASPYWKNIISFLNLGATSLTLSTFTGRFVFPLLSLEGRRFWLLGLLPMERRSILMSKFVFSLLGSLLISEGLIILSDWMIQVELPMALFHVGLVALICCGLSGIAVGLGAAHPNFSEESPSKIVSGYGGTLTLILSMVYIAVIIGLVAVPCHLYFARKLIGIEVFRTWIVAAGAAAVVVAGLATVVPLAIGGRAFERMEF